MNTDSKASQLWENIKTYAKKVGRVGARPVLLLYLVMTNDKTPRSAKVVIGSALAYLLLPINVISMKRHPLFGWVDEAASIALVYKEVKKYITPEMEHQADETLDKWFNLESSPS